MHHDTKKRRGALCDALWSVGTVLISAGACLIDIPAGLIVAGTLALAGAWLVARGEGGDGS